MAIGTTAAIIGSAVIGAGASILGSKSASKAASKAADAQSDASAEAARVQREMYQQNVQIQQPFLNTGMAAMGQINALLGLGGGVGVTTPTSQQNPAAPMQGLPTTVEQIPVPGGNGGSMISQLRNQVAQRIREGEPIDQKILRRFGLEGYAQQVAQVGQPQQQAPAPTAPASTTAEGANAAYERFKNYTGYQTRLDEANRGLNSAFAARGTIQSGAAMNAFGQQQQNFASNEFANYMGYLGGQQQLGPGAANALAGVGTNYANNASNIAINQGNNAANAAIAHGNAQMGMIGGIGNALGGMLGQLGGTSYSDRRLKKNIEKVGEYDNGLGKYQWIYNFDPTNTVCEGVMADEVKDQFPEAYSEDARGYGMVNYAAL